MNKIITQITYSAANVLILILSLLWHTTASADVSAYGNWTSGLTNGFLYKNSDKSQVLIFIAHAEHSSGVSLNSVNFGGIPMTKIVEYSEGSSYRAYTAAFVLNAKNLGIASGNSFVPAWSATPLQTAYSSVFLTGANQLQPIGAVTGQGGTAMATVSTSSVATAAGDYTVVAATSGNTGSYIVNNGFIESIEHVMASSDGVVGYKSAAGYSEFASVTQSTANRQSLIAFVVQQSSIAANTNANTYNMAISYDELGRLSSITHPSSITATGLPKQEFSYNSQIGNDSVSYAGQTVISATNYNSKGVAQRIDFPTPSGSGTSRIEKTYDNLSRLKSLQVNLNGSTGYLANNMNYNNDGFLQDYRRSDPGLNTTITYGYGEHGEHGELSSYQLGTAPAVNYYYDNQGNLRSHGSLNSAGLILPALPNQSFNLDNQHTAGWQYDSSGKVLSDNALAYHYNQLEQIETVADKLSNTVLAHYLYDGNAKRVREVVEDKVIYSIRSIGGQLISQEVHQTQENGSMKVTRKDLIYHNGQAFLEVTQSNGAIIDRQFQFRDRQGHPALTLSQSDNFQIRYHQYSPYGSLISAPNGNKPTLEYTGHERDEISGLDYMQQRYYSSTYAHFLRPDPSYDFSMTNPYSFNLYSYGRNNPVNNWDPTGLKTETAVETLSNLAVDLQVEGKTVQAHLAIGGAILVEFFAGGIGELTTKAIDGDEIGVSDVAFAALDVVPGGKGAKGGKAVLKNKQVAQSAGGALASLAHFFKGTKRQLKRAKSRLKALKADKAKGVKRLDELKAEFKKSGKVEPSPELLKKLEATEKKLAEIDRLGEAALAEVRQLEKALGN